MAAKQVSAAADNDTNILCDILAQQRQFQLRQESRLSTNSSMSFKSRQSQQQQQQQSQPDAEPNNSDQGNSTRQLADESDQQQQQQSPIKHKQRRKFSLSYAMSNLASLTSASKHNNPNEPTSLGGEQKLSGHFQRRSSLAGGSFGSDHLDDPITSAKSNQTATRSSVEKKKGFVQKAIRRGSKMFDSMMLLSAQQQQQQQQQKATGGDSVEQAADEQSFDSQEAEAKLAELPSAKTNQPAAECNQAAAADEQTYRSRRRKLRLGSIPHDLRRALSLSTNNSHHHHHHNSSHIFGGGGLNEKLPAESQAEPLSSLNSSTDRKQHEASGRLRRKNSLFSPLTASFHHYNHWSSSHQQPPQTLHQRLSSTTANNTNISNNNNNNDNHNNLNNNNINDSQSQTATAASNQSASFSLCQDHSRTYKLIIFGSSAVGKTSLIQRFLYGHFPVAHKPTVEELHSNKYNIPKLGEIYLEILDTSGTFEFPAMRRLSIEKGDAFILVFSLADEASWQEVIHLRELILEEKGEQQLAAANQTRQQQQPAGVAGSREEPIGSIYAAAARLTSAAARRQSVDPSHLPQTAAAASASAASEPNGGTITMNDSSSSNNNNNNNNNSSSNLDGKQRPMSHYNRQLSRVLQPAQKLHWDSSVELVEAERVEQLQTTTTNSGGGGSSSRTPIVVVANKCDLDQDQFQVKNVDHLERMVREQWGNSFVKCSAKEALNIDSVFKELLRQARAPDLLSQFVIDDHQQRRQSLPVLKNQLSAHHVKGLRNLYNQQQQQQQKQLTQPSAHSAAAAASASVTAGQLQHQQQEPRSLSSASDDSQCAIL